MAPGAMLARVLGAVMLVEGFGEPEAGSVCRPGDPAAVSCEVDGTGCDATDVTFEGVELPLLSWNAETQTEEQIGTVPSYALAGVRNTWEMYLHGPLFRERERDTPTGIPPVYVFATWMNRIYRFENFSQPVPGQPLRAQQKIVGSALAPSTAWPVEDADGMLQGLLVAEGQPWWLSNVWPLPHEIYKGGVDFMPVGERQHCTQIFPESGMHRLFGQVVNTVDCHKGAGVCFFTVWKFYDDQWPVWSNTSEKVAPDCLHYCIADRLDVKPTCLYTTVLEDEHGNPICHQKGKGAVHGMTIGNQDLDDPTKFEIFLVFTGGMSFTAGDSSMYKLTVQVDKVNMRLQTLSSKPFGQDLFSKLPALGQDAGGDHAWVDDTREWVWVSTFRNSTAGIHLLNYKTGALAYSIRGVNNFIKGQYNYAAGIHGIGAAGRPGSYLALATCGCHDAKLCAPMPWQFPVPESMWSSGVFFLIDLSKVPAPGATPQVLDAASLVV